MFLRHVLLILMVLVLGGCGHHLYHRVEQGETLYSISWQYGYDYEVVASWNDIAAPYQIKAGQVIHLAPQRQEVDRRFLSKEYDQVEVKPNQDRSVVVTDSASSRAVVNSANTVKPVPKSDSAVNKTSPVVVAKSSPSSHAQATGALTWRWPSEGRVVSDFKTGSANFKGLDIRGAYGQTVRAAASGRVVYSGNALKGYGNLVIIKHNDDYLSAYAHNKDLFVVEGDDVLIGQKIAEMGRSEKEDVALYFEIRRKGKPVDPYRYLPKKK